MSEFQQIVNGQSFDFPSEFQSDREVTDRFNAMWQAHYSAAAARQAGERQESAYVESEATRALYER